MPQASITATGIQQVDVSVQALLLVVSIAVSVITLFMLLNSSATPVV